MSMIAKLPSAGLDAVAEVLGAWGYSTGLQPNIIESGQYEELLAFLEVWNDVPIDDSGIISAAVVFRSPKGGSFILGSAKGDMIMTGTLSGTTPRFNNERWITERGKHWLVQVAKEGSISRIRVNIDPEFLRQRSLLTRIIRWINGGPSEFSGIVRSPLVLPILTQFFSMRQVARDSSSK